MKNQGKGEIQGFWLRQNDGPKGKKARTLQGFWLRQNDDVEVLAAEAGDEGYLLVGAMVAIFLVMLALGVAAGSIAKQLQREREVEAVNRGNQYVRAIRVFYRKNGNRYPSSIEQLENTNNQRYLRQRYLDPLTGKDDWRLIHLGENKTTVKGFFGEDLPGLPGGLGAAAGMVSPMGTSTTGGSSVNTSNVPIAGGSINGGAVSNALAGGAGSGTGSGASAFGGASSGAAGYGFELQLRVVVDWRSDGYGRSDHRGRQCEDGQVDRGGERAG